MTAEVELTRYSHLVDPHLSVWGWEIPVYLFLGGVAAGMMIVAGVLARDRNGKTPAAVQYALLVPVLLAIGMLALFFDLENKAHVYRFYLAFMPASPMSWGSWILLAVYPASVLLGLAGVTPDTVRRWAHWPLMGGADGWLCRVQGWAASRLPLLAISTSPWASAWGSIRASCWARWAPHDPCGIRRCWVPCFCSPVPPRACRR